jgi:hypothetical protein
LLILPASIGIIPASSAKLATNLPLRFGVVPKERHLITTYCTIVDSLFVFLALQGITSLAKD